MICPYHPDRTLVRVNVKPLFSYQHGMTYYRCPVAGCGFWRSDKYGRKNYKRGNKKSTSREVSQSDIPSDPTRGT